MADAAVSFLLDNLKQLLDYHVDLIKNVKTELEKLQNDLRLFQAFLIKATTKKWRNDESLRELIKEIRDIVYEAEDVIDSFVTMATVNKQDVLDYLNPFKKPLTLHSIAQEVENVSVKVRDMYGGMNRIDFALKKIDADPVPAEEIEAPIVRQLNIVGFEEEREQFVGYLKEERKELEVLSIIGMPGLGKTTLAGMIFRHPDIVYEFPTRIWVYISQELNRKNVLLEILKKVTSVTDDMVKETDSQLAERVDKCLEKGKFLIVMDDVWTAEDWRKLRDILPMSKGKGKVLITSRQMEVGNAANRDNRPPHKLRFLTQEESWLLLRLEVFNNREPRTELKVYGESILKKCDGLPLSIVVIGGILSERVSATDVSGMITMWKEVSENVNVHVVTEDATKRVEKIIALSYDKLPYYLKACFLYLGMFPEDFEIPTWKLTRMWIGEGFIQQKTSSLEESAENYLDDLINRNLLRVDKRGRNGKVKTCRIHDTIRDFCITEAGNERENFLQEIKKSSERAFDPPVANVVSFRRICIHYNVVVNFLCLKPHGPKVRSFVCFSREETTTLPEDKNSAIPASFKLLRVLDVQPIIFSKVPKGIDQLLHLRFISVSLNLGRNILPVVFSKLWNIQTLLVNTKYSTLDIKADIWKMKRLRHFKTNASATLPTIGEGSPSETCEIKTLGTISPQSCTKSVFDRAIYVKNIGIRGDLAILFESKKEILFNNMVKLDCLEKLKLINDVPSSSTSDNRLQSLPPANRFPPSLRRLTLSKTFLKWSEMSVLGEIEELEVLKLLENALVGKTWEATDNHFLKLEVLVISRTDLVTWTASQHHFPKLRSLELSYCDKLIQIPEELANTPNFQMLSIHRCDFAATLAEKFLDNIKIKLSIFPPLEKTSI